MGLAGEILDAVTGNLANDLIDAAQRRTAATGLVRRIDKYLNPEQLHRKTKAIISESLAEVLANLGDMDTEEWKAVLTHAETKHQMLDCVLACEEDAVPEIGEWSLENAPDPDMLRDLLLRLHSVIQEKKRKHFLPEFFNLRRGQEDIQRDIREGFAQIQHVWSERDRARPTGGHHRDIDSAAEYLMQDKPATALDLLRKLERDNWGTMDDREKYRVQANIGHSLRVMGKYPDAAQSYLTAKQYQPTDENARWMESLAYGLLDNKEKAHTLAGDLMRDFPELPRATAAWVATSETNLPFAEIESAVSDQHRSDPEVASNLAQQAAMRREFASAEVYARKALDANPDWVEPKIQLASVILGRQMHDLMHGKPLGLTTTQPERMAESARLFEEGIAQLPSHANPAQIARIKTELALVHELLGDCSKAFGVMMSAYDAAPKSPDVRYAYVAHLPDQHIDTFGAQPVGKIVYDLSGNETYFFRSREMYDVGGEHKNQWQAVIEAQNPDGIIYVVDTSQPDEEARGLSHIAAVYQDMRTHVLDSKIRLRTLLVFLNKCDLWGQSPSDREAMMTRYRTDLKESLSEITQQFGGLEVQFGAGSLTHTEHAHSTNDVLRRLAAALAKKG